MCTPYCSFKTDSEDSYGTIQIHNISPLQVWVGVVGVGPQGAALNSSYANRDNQAYKDDLGIAISNFARIIPGGLLVFFPSYIVLQSCVDAWKSMLKPGAGGTVWERICRHKQPVIEPRASCKPRRSPRSSS